MNILVKRIITTIVYGLVIIGSVWWGLYSFFAIFFLFQLLCLNEFYQFVNKNIVAPNKYLGLFSSSLFFLSSVLCLISPIKSYIYLLPLFILFRFLMESLKRKTSGFFLTISYTILGVIYLTAPFVCLNYMAFYHNNNYTPSIILGYLLLLLVCDTGSYFAASLWGKHKIFERIASHKTWEGLAGGSILCLGTSYFISLFIKDLTFTQWLIIAILTIVTFTFSDLGKHILNLSIGLKNSKNVLPGYGGILNRIDSFLFATPVVTSYLLLI